MTINDVRRVLREWKFTQLGGDEYKWHFLPAQKQQAFVAYIGGPTEDNMFVVIFRGNKQVHSPIISAPEQLLRILNDILPDNNPLRMSLDESLGNYLAPHVEAQELPEVTAKVVKLLVHFAEWYRSETVIEDADYTAVPAEAMLGNYAKDKFNVFRNNADSAGISQHKS